MYALLERQNLAPRNSVPFTPEYLVPGFWSVDLETTGTDASVDKIVGIGLANEERCFYIDLASWQEQLGAIQTFLHESTLVAFNTLFDGAFLQKFLGEWPRFVGCAYGLFKQMSTEGFVGQSWALERLQLDVLGWQTTNKEALDKALAEHKLTKAELWKLPVEILAPYCAGDADAALAGWVYLRSAAVQFPSLLDYHDRLFMNEVRLLAEQQLRGIQVHQPRLATCRLANEQAIQGAMSAFLGHPQVAPFVAEQDAKALAAWNAAQPSKLTAKGEVSKRWEAWEARKPKSGFNPNSKQQLAELFYKHLGLRVAKRTETGRESVDRKVLPGLGEPGQLLTEYNLLVKRRGYIEATAEKSARDGVIHLQFNSVGAVSGRLGGSGGWNAQQMPKNRGFLECLAARFGQKLIQFDFNAVEPMILAEFSQDKTLLALYGPDAKPNDVYLYLLGKIPALGAVGIREIYDPDNPTPEGIAAAKKKYKYQRGTAKKCKLSYDYGARAPKIHEILTLDGIKITLQEVQEIVRGLDKLFAGIRRFDAQLRQMWSANGGYIINALGRPLAVAETQLKDLISRFVQTSAHDALQLFIWNLERERQRHKLPWSPWIIDLHDEVIVECPAEAAEVVAQSFVRALAATNAELGMEIKLRGEPQIADTLADIKTGE